MGSVLTTASKIACAHQGKGVATGAPQLTVNGKPVLTQTGIGALVITPGTCTQVGTGLVPCAKLGPPPPPTGFATKLTIGGQAAALESLTAMTNGVPVNTLTVMAGQSKLMAI